MDERSKHETFNTNSGAKRDDLRPEDRARIDEPFKLDVQALNQVQAIYAKHGEALSKLSERDRGSAETHVEHAVEQIKESQGNFQRFRGVRQRKEEDRLYGKMEANRVAPRPDPEPVTRLRSLEEIRAEARENVERAHMGHLTSIVERLDQRLEQLVARAQQRDAGRDPQLER